MKKKEINFIKSDGLEEIESDLDRALTELDRVNLCVSELLQDFMPASGANDYDKKELIIEDDNNEQQAIE